VFHSDPARNLYHYAALTYKAQDAAHCYTCSVVCLSVGNDSQPYKKGWTDRGVVWGVHSSESKEACAMWGPEFPRERGTFVVYTWACSVLPAVDILHLIAAAVYQYRCKLF